jgi:multimeric flavodoxin WrbA
MRITAIVGTYRKGGVIDTAVDEILGAASAAGAETAKVYLIDKRIEFCTNCRTCTQEGGRQRGECVIDDDMAEILDGIEQSDALVLASPINFGNVTAVTKKFIERLVCYAEWPWGTNFPKVRNKRKDRAAVVVMASAAPGWMARLFSRVGRFLKDAAGLLGARTIGVLAIGLAAGEERHDIGERARKKARRLGEKLVAARRG